MNSDTRDSNNNVEQQQQQAPPSTLSTTAMESIKSILNTPADPNQFTSSSSKVKLSWLASPSEEDDDTIEIVEELPVTAAAGATNRPLKNSWRSSRPKHEIDRMVTHQESSESSAIVNSNDSVKSMGMGTKPKLSNISLLTTSVAHATLERCLLGINRGDAPSQQNTCSPNNDATTINYSKQCKPGHIIDLLELRRLSSRGIPDEPPELPRDRASSAPSLDPTNDLNDHNLRSSTSAGNIQSKSGNPHRSYRPLVWRVLLGYLPPETDMWNEVLSRDRKLYNNFVEEMFSSTCPKPHEVFEGVKNGEQKGQENVEWQQQEEQEEEQFLKAQEYLKGNAVYRTDSADDTNNNLMDAPSTPKPNETEETIQTPGLLSARMQQEWVRGDESVFQTPKDGSECNNDGNGSSSYNRISPLCAMNTPRIRARKALSVGSTISEEKGHGDDTLLSKSCGTTESATVTQPNSTEKTQDANGTMNALLLPDDMEDSLQKDFTRSVSITTTESGKAEAVELCHQDGTECNNNNNDNNNTNNSDNNNNNNEKPPITLSPSQDLDEEENILLLDEIRKDVIRTHPDLRFFLEPKEDLGQKRYAALERILFVWAKLNKGVRYVQGMNEIVGTLYFVLAHDSNEDWANEAEADTYFLFNSIMVEMRDVFVPDLDESDSGIHGRISNMITLLALHDPEVRCHLDSVGIDPSFYSVRWLTTLLSREFLLPDTIRLWDSMFASTHKDNFLRYVSVTMVMVMRNQILQGDFSTCLRLLQAFPPTNLDRLLESSRALWIYESQITLACHKGGISLGHALRSIAPPPAIIMAYGLHGGIAPPIRDQVRQVGERGLKAARGAANGASSAGKSFFGSAMGYWRSGSSVNKQKK